MLIDQKLKIDGDKVTLRNTVDVSAEIRAAQAMTERGGGRFGDKNSECVMMGYIPPVMSCIKKFFQLNPAFAVVTPKKYVQGCSL